MGITTLLKELDDAMAECNLKEMAGQTAAVDISCFMHAAMSTNGDTNQYVYRKLLDLQQLGIKPLVVFDGPAPEAKAKITEIRQRSNQGLRERARIFSENGDVEKAEQLTRRAEGRTARNQEEIKKFCRLKQIEYVESPFEADAQIAYLIQNNLAQFVITEDSDLILYNCKKILFKLNKREAYLYDQAKFESCWGAPFEVDCLTAVCICVGCDYFPGGIRGFGMKKAKELYPHLLPAFDFDQLLSLLEQFHFEVAEDFAESFNLAFSTFKHQLVYSPTLKSLVPVTPYKEGFSHVDYPFAGIPSDRPVDHWTPVEAEPPPQPQPKPVPGHGYHCSVCGLSFAFSKELKAHRESVHPVKCPHPDCPKSFACQKYLKDHMDRHLPERIHKCDQCESSFWTFSELRRHRTKQHSGKFFKCPRCGLVLTRSDGLADHLKICERPKKAYPCALCNGSYDTWLRLDAHMRRVHKISRRSQKREQQKNKKD